MSTSEPIRNKNEICDLIEYYWKRGEMRNYVLITLCLYTALRIGDILELTWDHVYDFKRARISSSITLTEQKTGKSKIIALNDGVVTALTEYLPSAEPGSPIIINKRTGKAIKRVQAYRLIRSAAESVNCTTRVSCHSLRKTFGYHAWKSGAPVAVIMEIYNHSSMAVTRRYLGITQDEKNTVYLDLDFAV